MSRPIPPELEAQIRWRNEHPNAPQSHEWGINDRRVLLAEVERLRAENAELKRQPMLWQPTTEVGR